MEQYGNLIPSTWSPGYIVANRAECLKNLRLLVATAEDCLREGDYYKSARCMKMLCVGLIKLENQNIADFGKQEIMLGLMIPMVLILGLLCKDAPESRRRDAALTYAGRIATEPDHEFAACYHVAKEQVLSYIKDLRSGMPLESITRKYNFPADVFDTLRSLDRDIAAAASGCAVPVSSSPAASEPALPGRTQAPALRTGKKGKRRRFWQTAESFEEWMELHGIREDDLEEVTRRVKLRRNIYGVLSFCTPLGLVLLPFWYVAVMLTKMLRTRDLYAEPGALCKFITVLYIIGTLVIPSTLLLILVSGSKWGMGLGTRASRVLNTLLGSSILLFTLWILFTYKSPIPFIVCVILLAVFLVIRWCRRVGSPVPALVLGGLSVVALAAFLVSGRANIFVLGTQDSAETNGVKQTESPPAETQETDPSYQAGSEEGFIFPDSDTQLIVQQDIQALSDSDLTYAINEIYARHGYLFQNDELRTHFEQFSWYSGHISPEEFSIDFFNQIEQQNWKQLVNERNRRTQSD